MNNKKDLKIYCIDSYGTLLDAAQVIEKNKSRAVVVIEKEKVIGLISEGDLVRCLLHGTDIHARVLEFITTDFVFLTEYSLEKALQLFREHYFGLIPVLDDNMHLTDIITVQDMFNGEN